MQTKEIDVAARGSQTERSPRRRSFRRPVLVIGGLAASGLLAFGLQVGDGGSQPAPSGNTPSPMVTVPGGPAVDGPASVDG